MIRGRFAPSPTGLLHQGSLVAALASYLDAKKQGGSWLVRIEDVDETRAIPGMDKILLQTLEDLGFEWDEDVIYQSQRKARYQSVIDDLLNRNLVYPCGCTRREISDAAVFSMTKPVYPGTCSKGIPSGKLARSLRMKTGATAIRFHDCLAGEVSQQLDKEVGDFIIQRADGFTAYQLAVVIDDEDQRINQIVRGEDLLFSTPQQCYLQQILNFTQPVYAHIPLVLDAQGRKLSKQQQDKPIDQRHALDALIGAFRFLQPTAGPLPCNIREFWFWALEHWVLVCRKAGWKS